MHSEQLAYRADGLNMVGELFLPQAASGRAPGVLVFPEAFGLGPHVRERARRLAEAGYVALACDLHGNQSVVETLDEAVSLVNPLRAEPERARARARGAQEALGARDELIPGKIAAIGYCYGGTLALELARGGAELAGVAGFHSGLASSLPAEPGRIRAPVLVCIGADDPGIPPAQRQAFQEEMTAAEADWQMHLYGGVVHSFTNPAADDLGRPDFARYDAVADARSWTSLHGFLQEIFG